MKNKIALNFIIFSLLVTSFCIYQTTGSEVQEAFSINFLTPDVRPERISASNLIAEKLALIGVNIITNDIASWEDVGERVWGYPVGFTEYDYIPTYDEGGYDIAFLGWTCVPWNPSERYDSASITPAGDNFYQYSNTVLDDLMANFIAETDPTLKANYAKDIQAILYNDLPDIVLFYYSENSALNGSLQAMVLNMKHPIIGTGESTPLGTKEAAKYVRKAISHSSKRFDHI